MKSDLIDDLRGVDPARAHPAAPEPDWDTIAHRILAAPRRPPRRRPGVVFALAAGAALTAAAAVALMPAPPSVLERAYAAASHNAVYHYVVTSQEFEGPQRRPLDDTRSSREGWIDPTTGEIHEISDGGDEWATDGKRRTTYTAFNNALQEYDEPATTATAAPARNDVLAALTSSIRAGAMSDEGLDVFEGRRVRRLVAHNPRRTWRQTFLVDAETYLPVLFRSETGDHVRDGSQIGPRQRVTEERFERFERLPPHTDRAVLEMRPHPDARRQPQSFPRGPAAQAPPPRAAAP